MEVGKRLYSIQMLRAIAASLIVLAHEQNHLEARGYVSDSTRFLHFGSAGVDIFFVISGFIMVFVGWQRFQEVGSSRDFMIMRIIRIVPAYWFYTILISLLLIFFQEYFSKGKSFDLGHFLASLFFVPWSSGGSTVNPVLGVGWTLNFEMYFYAIFATLLLFPARIFLPSLALWLTSIVVVGSIFWDDIVVLSVATSPLVLEFLIGSAIGTFYMRQSPMTQQMAAVLLVAGAIGFSLGFAGQIDGLTRVVNPGGDMARVIKWGIPSGLLIAGVVFLERAKAIPVCSLLVKLGDSSYSFYLTHVFAISVLGFGWVRIFNGYYILFIATSFVCSLLVGHVSHLLIEKPMIGYLSGHYREYRQRIDLREGR